MNLRASIRRNPAGRWMVHLPQFGFTPTRPAEFRTWREAMAFVDRRKAQTAGLGLTQEREPGPRTVFATGNTGGGWW